jgi:hypothetical protein
MTNNDIKYPKIAAIFESRSKISPIPLSDNPQEQKNAPNHLIFELDVSGKRHFFRHSSLYSETTINYPLPPVNGLFSFVILADDPGRVHVGVPIYVQAEMLPLYESLETYNLVPKYGIDGHKSISHGSDVLYSGEVVLEKGYLLQWNNCSGHYKPEAHQRELNLLPIVNRVLPNDLFVKHIPEEDKSPLIVLDLVDGGGYGQLSKTDLKPPLYKLKTPINTRKRSLLENPDRPAEKEPKVIRVSPLRR